MSSNYPPGPMLASGVYDVETTETIYCNECDRSTTTEVTQRGHLFLFDCPKCGAPNEVEDYT